MMITKQGYAKIGYAMLGWRWVYPEIAGREKAIIDVMMVFLACYGYKSRPTFEQFVSFVIDAEAAGYSTEDLYRIFVSGQVPADLDALVRQYIIVH